LGLLIKLDLKSLFERILMMKYTRSGGNSLNYDLAIIFSLGNIADKQLNNLTNQLINQLTNQPINQFIGS